MTERIMLIAALIVWAAGLLQVGAAHGAERPVMQSLINAANGPALSARLELQSAQAASAFTNNGTAVPASAGAPKAGLAAATPAPPPGSLRITHNPPPVPDKEVRNLRIARGVGIGAAALGLGLFAFSVATAGSGAVVAAAALVFFGGLTAYLAHRRINGKDDFNN